MIDFDKYGGGDGGEPLDPSDLLALFESLDRKTSHTELRKAQIEACRALTTSRQNRDHVLKVSTGAGKTTVGLLYLHSHAREKAEPVVYLCPTSQLVHQVLAEAEALGLRAVEYPANQPHVDPAAQSGDAITVCTYKKLFTGRTTFDRTDVNLRPCAMVLDDAHAGIEEVRDSFTIKLAGKSNLAKKLRDLFEGSIASWMPGVWSGVVREDPAALIEVPFWVWRPLLPQIRTLLADSADSTELVFVWPHIRDRLEFSRCVVGGSGIEIGPDVPPVEFVPAYEGAAHRLFMSATLADDSALVRELGCDRGAALQPLIPTSDAGVGERMVIAPTLLDPALNREWIMKWSGRIAPQVRVVVLTSSGKAARGWALHGAHVAEDKAVEPAVEELRAGTKNFVAFANRYDGVDLPDAACRVLILDGMPYGESLISRHDAMIPGRPSASQNRLVHRIEQGMGRAVRSHVDYAVIVLCGPELASFVSRNDVKSHFNPATRAQLDLARKLAQIGLEETKQGGAEVAFRNLVQTCLGRDAGWKKFYDNTVRKAATATRAMDVRAIELAAVERECAMLAWKHRPKEAGERLLEASRAEPGLSDAQVGWYLQSAAAYLAATDTAEALKLQAAAHAKNHRMMPPPGGTAMRLRSAHTVSSANVLRWYSDYDNPNGAIAGLQDIRARLSFGASPSEFEQAVCDLAAVVGAVGGRPELEYGKGPDDLWLWEDHALVIECKNEEQSDRLPKRDSGQLHDSVQWAREHLPTFKHVPVVIARADEPHDRAHFPEGTRVVTPADLGAFLQAVEGFIVALTRQPATAWSTTQIGQLAAQHGTGLAQALSRYFKHLS